MTTKSFLFFRLGLVGALLLACVAVWPTRDALAAGSAQPTRGAPGTVFSFSATGYRANERINIWVNTPTDQPQDVSVEVRADATGAVAWQWTAPAGAAGGTWRMVAQGRISRLETIIPVQIDSAVPTATPSGPTADASAVPNSGGPGTRITLTAGGFRANERLDTWANTPNGAQRDVPTWVFANGQGVATWEWTVPADAENGTWQLIGRGIDSRTIKVITVQIIAGPPTPTPAADSGVTPSSGVPGTTFSFYATGFRENEEVTFWGSAPNGTVETNAKKVRADATGRATWTWVAPADAVPGLWTMTAQGTASRAVRQISFGIAEVPSAPLPPDGVVPANGVPGTTFRFGVSGFEFEAHLTSWTIDPNGVASPEVARFRADRNGHAELEWTAPADAHEGPWQMVIYGTDSRITKFIPFHIDRYGAPVSATEGVTPSSGTYGTELHFFADNLPPNVLVGYWATDPAGAIVPSGREVKANSAGRAEWSWTIPQNVRTGIWVMTIKRAQADRSGAPDVTRSIRFEVVR